MPKLIKSDEDWQRELNDDQYNVCRLRGTEPPFSGEYCDCYTPGTYTCTCCDSPLFLSTAKFDSGTGWPSFFDTYNKQCIVTVCDHTHGMNRVEVRCCVCDAHLGHVFKDGPASTGLRYCINSVALKLIPK